MHCYVYVFDMQNDVLFVCVEMYDDTTEIPIEKLAWTHSNKYNWICKEMKRKQSTYKHRNISTAYQASQTEVYEENQQQKKEYIVRYIDAIASHRIHIPIHLKAYDFAS